MKAKKLLAILLSIVMALALVACGNDAGTTTDSGDAGTTDTNAEADAGSDAGADQNAATGGNKVGISMPTKSLERWNRDGSFLEEKFTEKGYEVKLTFSDNKIDQQVKDIEGLLADGVNLLVIAAIDSESLSQVLAQAKEQNVTVISYDRLIMQTDAISYYVSFDNYKVGQLQGEFVKDQLDLDNAKGPFNIEFTSGDPADNNAKFFFGGAKDVLQPYLDDGKLVVQSGQTEFDQVATQQWDTAKALTRFQNILGSNYADKQLDVALCSNDSTALGVTQAIESDYSGKNKVLVTGQDGDEANLANIVDGKQTMTVFKAVANLAEVTLALGDAILSGKQPGEELIGESGWSFECSYNTDSYDNGTGFIPSYLLVPTVVTKDNIQQELVDTGYYTMDDKGYPHPVG